MEVQIPSPSVFLKKSPILTPAPAVPPKRAALAKAKTSAPVKAPNKPATTLQDAASTKPKQSKSRNGCMTCKKKRLKCDETKPSCAQCQKRSVVCEGYKKDYKWRTFEETTFNPKPAAKRKAFRSNSFSTTHNGARPLDIAGGGRQGPTYDGFADGNPPQTWSPGLHTAFTTAAYAFQGPSQGQGLPSTSRQQSNVKLQQRPSSRPDLTTDSLSMSAFDGEDLSPHLAFGEHADPYSLLTTSANSPIGDSKSVRSFSSGSPRLLDLLLPGTDLNQPPDPSEVRPPLSPVPYQPSGFDHSMILAEDFDEEIIRSDAMATTTGMPSMAPTAGRDTGGVPTWHGFRASSPTPTETSTTSSKSSGMTILAQPSMDASSPEMLMLRFDKQTCGILSVKDGPTENPWRTLIWPLARESPALYHAISSMTAFHGAHEVPMLHTPGMAHMTKSIKKLAFEIENMRLDSALATSLALAFSEGWDSHVSTGVQHLRGAKIMVNNAMVKHRRDMQLGQLTTQDANRLKFLCNTFVYMDVIARLTSLEEANELNFEEILTTVNGSFGDQMEVDPLMGCATTLFPLIGRVANLIQRVRKTESNSLTLVSTAMELKELLQQWQIPSALLFERPEDPNSEVQHSIQTAEAYRYATLLYLHQAVPEIPSDSAQTLAKKVLVTLASVPLSSRTTIVQIFPLFAASCEVTDPEDRNWVQQRWVAMMARLKIGNVTSCWSVVQEVWARRDDFANEKTNRLLRRFSSRGVPTGNFVPPVLNMPPGLKRKAHTFDVANEDGFFNEVHDDFQQGGSAGNVVGAFEGLDQAGRPLKRRVTMDPMSEGLDMSMPLGVGGAGVTGFGLPASNRNRRTTSNITSPDQLGEEYTVRGRLHWLGVMSDWQWEVFLG